MLSPLKEIGEILTNPERFACVYLATGDATSYSLSTCDR